MPKFLHEFLEYSNGSRTDNGWWKIDEVKGKLLNGVGGWHNYEPKQEDIIVEADNWEDLDWSCLVDNTKPYGWIDPQGIFYGCGFMEHSELSRLFFKSSERELEELGYIKIYRDFDGQRNYYCYRNPTKKQEDYLIECGLYKENYYD